MAGASFSLTPRAVPAVHTKYRTIRTHIPVPETLGIFEKLERFESRSMHGALPVVWDRAEDFQVFDTAGNCWIDFTSTIFVANGGHSNAAVIRALKKQIDGRLLHTYTFASDIRARFIERLIELTPPYLEKAFLLSAGTEATECALKLMRMYGRSIDEKKLGVLSFRGCMHGRTLGAEMLKGDPVGSAWIGCRDPNIHHLPFPVPWDVPDPDSFDWGKRFREDIDTLIAEGLDPDTLCGCMIESYQGWSALFLPNGYVRALSDFARKHDVLMTFDDIQGGFGRTGTLFAYEQYGVEPDMVCLGKALSGGLPLSAVLGRKEIMDIPDVGSMSSTHSANPLCCAAALANLEDMTARGLVSEAERKGNIMKSRLDDMKKRYPACISHIVARGMIAALVFVDPRTGGPASELATRVCERAMEKGVLVVHTGRESIKLGPPLTIPDDALLEGLDAIEESLVEIIGEAK